MSLTGAEKGKSTTINWFCFLYFPLWKIPTEGSWVEVGHRADLWGRKEIGSIKQVARYHLKAERNSWAISWCRRILKFDDLSVITSRISHLCPERVITVELWQPQTGCLCICEFVVCWLGSDRALFPSSRNCSLYSHHFELFEHIHDVETTLTKMILLLPSVGAPQLAWLLSVVAEFNQSNGC